MNNKTCNHAASGCDYPAGECSGACLKRAQADARPVEPFWHAVVSASAPIIDKAIRRQDVAEEYADKCRENHSDVRVVALYTHPEASAPGLSDEERTAFVDWWNAGDNMNKAHRMQWSSDIAWFAWKARASRYGRELGEEQVEQLVRKVETAVGMSRQAWDCVDAKEIVRAVLNRASAANVGDPGAVEWRIPMHLMNGVERGRPMKLSANAMLDKNGNLIIETPLLEYSGFQSKQTATVAEPSARIEKLRKGLFEARDALAYAADLLPQRYQAKDHRFFLAAIERANNILSGANNG